MFWFMFQVNHIKCLNAATLGETIIRVVRKIIPIQLARETNWTGKNGKIPFKRCPFLLETIKRKDHPLESGSYKLYSCDIKLFI